MPQIWGPGRVKIDCATDLGPRASVLFLYVGHKDAVCITSLTTVEPSEGQRATNGRPASIEAQHRRTLSRSRFLSPSHSLPLQPSLSHSHLLPKCPHRGTDDTIKVQRQQAHLDELCKVDAAALQRAFENPLKPTAAQCHCGVTAMSLSLACFVLTGAGGTGESLSSLRFASLGEESLSLSLSLCQALSTSAREMSSALPSGAT